ncbi:MAG: ABC transporter permease [Phycisphaeraceae bacterium]|nr:ABC transporter permease [Phycisphaeraceae bacterium]
MLLVERCGVFTLFCAVATRWFLFRPGRWFRGRLILPQMFQIGTRSAPVVMVVGAFIGMVLAVEMYAPFLAIGQETRLGGIIGISVIKQIGPVLAAVMLAGRVGGAVSAELGTMRVTEQIDALRCMGVDPIAYLVVPRVFACVVMIPILTIFSDLLGIIGGYLVTVRGYGVSSQAYWDFAGQFIVPYDVLTGLLKTLVFGLAIGLISCYKGFHCASGARGVGRAATDAFVASFLAIIVMNFFLAKLLNDAYIWVVGPGGPSALG